MARLLLSVVYGFRTKSSKCSASEKTDIETEKKLAASGRPEIHSYPRKCPEFLESRRQSVLQEKFQENKSDRPSEVISPETSAGSNAPDTIDVTIYKNFASCMNDSESSPLDRPNMLLHDCFPVLSRSIRMEKAIEWALLLPLARRTIRRRSRIAHGNKRAYQWNAKLS